MKVLLIPMLLGFSLITYSQSPIPSNANDANEYVRQHCPEAQALWQKGDRKGIELLNELLRYLDQPMVRDFAAGNFSLYTQRANIYLYLAEAYALQDKQQESLNYLAKTADFIQSPIIATYLENNKSFDRFRQNSEFIAVLKKLHKFETYWDPPALNTAYQENLSDAEKIAGISKLWSEVKYNFAYPEKLIELNWDKLYLETIPKVLATKSTLEYYSELIKLCARLADGHTNINLPDQLSTTIPPLRTALVEGHVLILELLSDSLKARGLRAGTEILEIDGQQAIAYARQSIEPYQSAVTQQYLQARTFGYELLRGPGERIVRLKLLDAQGNTSDFELQRGGYWDVRMQPPLEFRMLANGAIAYVALNDFGTQEVTKLWTQIFPKVLGSTGLILDLRRNGGGDSSIAYEILKSLLSKPAATSRSLIRRYSPAERAQNLLSIDWTEIPSQEIKPRDGAQYTKPTIVLAGPETFSAAEDFLLAWKNSGRGPIIGEPSAGSTGTSLFIQLPGGGNARVCTKRDTFPDGREWVGKGIFPDIPVQPSLVDVKAGKDSVLEKALDYLYSLKESGKRLQ
jgi:carboxyl-terminal processing protease